MRRTRALAVLACALCTAVLTTACDPGDLPLAAAPASSATSSSSTASTGSATPTADAAGSDESDVALAGASRPDSRPSRTRKHRPSPTATPAPTTTPAPASTTAAPPPAPAPPAAEGDLLWNGDIETGDLSQFEVGSWNDVGGTHPTVVTSPVRDGRYAVRLGITGATTSSDGICCGSRDELLPLFRNLKEGDDLWFGFSTYLAPGFPLSGGWQVITQFKQNFDGSPPLALYVEEGQYKAEGGYGAPGGPKPFMKPLAPATTGTWVDWQFHVKFSSNPAVGYVEIWKDGTQVLQRFAPSAGTLYAASGAKAGSYVKTGPYRDPTITTPATMYLDSWRIGRTQASVSR